MTQHADVRCSAHFHHLPLQVPDPSRLPSIVPTAICCMGIDPKKAAARGPLRPYYQYGVVR